MIRIKNNKFLIGTQVMKLVVDKTSDYDSVRIVEDLKFEGHDLNDYLALQKESEVDNIVAAIEKTGFDYFQLVKHYLRIAGAQEKVVNEAESRLDMHNWENLMEECGYRV